MQRLADAIRGHFRSTVEPYWQQARAHIDADRARRARAFLDGGTDGLLSSYLPMMRWSSPVLSVDVLQEQDVHLNGRGLLLVPSFMSVGTPDFLHDTTLPQVLVYPVEHSLAVSAATLAPRLSLAPLIGETRTAVLESIGGGQQHHRAGPPGRRQRRLGQPAHRGVAQRRADPHGPRRQGGPAHPHAPRERPARAETPGHGLTSSPPPR
nr:hypothetical protein GCM10020092_079340 [Actinoplanes digitatis]